MNELAKNLMCICMRNGVQIWIEQERTVQLQNILERLSGSKFILFENQTINTADIVGIFTAENMRELTMRKNGKWQCDVAGTWHEKKEECTCVYPLFARWEKEKNKIIKACQTCKGSGYEPYIDEKGNNFVRECSICVHKYDLTYPKPIYRYKVR